MGMKQYVFLFNGISGKARNIARRDSMIGRFSPGRDFTTIPI